MAMPTPLCKAAYTTAHWVMPDTWMMFSYTDSVLDSGAPIEHTYATPKAMSSKPSIWNFTAMRTMRKMPA